MKRRTLPKPAAKATLTPGEIDRYSPILHIGAGTPMTIAVGAAELPELVRHTIDYGAAAVNKGVPVTRMSLDHHDHFTVLEELASPKGVLSEALEQAFAITSS